MLDRFELVYRYGVVNILMKMVAVVSDNVLFDGQHVQEKVQGKMLEILIKYVFARYLEILS